jgi:hypothetical protein
MKETREVLTPALAEEYAREGVVRLPGLVSAGDTAAMAAAVWRKLDVTSQRDGRPSHLSSRSGEFDAIANPTIRTLLDELLGEWEEPNNWGLPLVAFHTGEAAWDVPYQNWHLDFGAPGGRRLARFFVVLEPSRPGGGGTGYVAGSHRLIEPLCQQATGKLSSPRIRGRLEAQAPWFAALTSRRQTEDRVRRFMQEGAEIDGVQVRVCEMLGEPGDVILMHPLMLHAPMPNVLPTPRMMLTQFVYARP